MLFTSFVMNFDAIFNPLNNRGPWFFKSLDFDISLLVWITNYVILISSTICCKSVLLKILSWSHYLCCVVCDPLLGCLINMPACSCISRMSWGMLCCLYLQTSKIFQMLWMLLRSLTSLVSTLFVNVTGKSCFPPLSFSMCFSPPATADRYCMFW